MIELKNVYLQSQTEQFKNTALIACAMKSRKVHIILLKPN